MMKNTHPQIANFISSQQTVSSEIQERAISLGKAIVKELGLERDVDTLSRWMIHYLAEQIALVEKGSDLEKTEAKQRYFETILKLWQHRSDFQAAYHLRDETTKTWLEKVKDIADNSDSDLSIISHIVGNFEENKPDERV